MKGWDTYFSEMVELVASKSKDPSTKVGAVLVNPQNRVKATGFNGFPHQVEDLPSAVPERYERPEKYVWTVHAEMNAIIQAASEGVAINGCRLYCSLMPCAECAKHIAQAGITEVIVPVERDSNLLSRWEKSFEDTRKILTAADVVLRFYGDFNPDFLKDDRAREII